jgi:integrase
MRSRSFDTRRDAIEYDAEVKVAKRRGVLAALSGGKETLDEYVVGTWIPVHVAPLADKTAKRYAQLYDGHISPGLGGYRLRELTPEVIARWQADRLRADAPVESTRKALTVLGGILQRAYEAGRITSNPQRLVRKAAPAATEEVRPLAPAAVEAIRSALLAGAGRDHESTRHDARALAHRDSVMVSILAYAGLRPGEMRALQWRHVQERTLIVVAAKTVRHRQEPRTVRLLAPLAHDLREWRMASGRPVDAQSVVPALNGSPMTENAFEMWRSRAWTAALGQSGIPYKRPYDLRHSFASLLIHEGRSAVYVGKQLGHSPTLTLKRYGHVIDELEDSPRIGAEHAILAARNTPDALHHVR